MINHPRGHPRTNKNKNKKTKKQKNLGAAKTWIVNFEVDDEIFFFFAKKKIWIEIVNKDLFALFVNKKKEFWIQISNWTFSSVIIQIINERIHTYHIYKCNYIITLSHLYLHFLQM